MTLSVRQHPQAANLMAANLMAANLMAANLMAANLMAADLMAACPWGWNLSARDPVDAASASARRRLF